MLLIRHGACCVMLRDADTCAEVHDDADTAWCVLRAESCVCAVCCDVRAYVLIRGVGSQRTPVRSVMIRGVGSQLTCATRAAC